MPPSPTPVAAAKPGDAPHLLLPHFKHGRDDAAGVLADPRDQPSLGLCATGPRPRRDLVLVGRVVAGPQGGVPLQLAGQLGLVDGLAPDGTEFWRRRGPLGRGRRHGQQRAEVRCPAGWAYV